MEIKKKWRDTRSFLSVVVFKKTPVIVYAPGRVGSMSLITALHKQNLLAFKVEWLSSSLGSVELCRKHIFKKERSAKIITLVRDPVEILVSLFFSKAGRGHLPQSSLALRNNDSQALIKGFQEELLKSDFFFQHLYWYEKEFNPHVGFNIFTFPFDTQAKCGSVPHDTYPTLILRTDLTNNEKERHIKQFLDIDHLSIDHTNSKDQRSNAELYKRFKETLILPPEFLHKIYSAPYSTHFFTQEEIDHMEEHWSRNTIG